MAASPVHFGHRQAEHPCPDVSGEDKASQDPQEIAMLIILMLSLFRALTENIIS